MAKQPLKVLHVPTAVGGNPQGLSQHLEKIGVQSESWVFQSNYLGYAADYVIWKKTDRLLVRELKRLRAITKAALCFDVIHFNFGQTLAHGVASTRHGSIFRRACHALYEGYLNYLQLLELNLYKRLDVALFVHYQGDDARQGDASLRLFKYSAAQRAAPGHYSTESDHFKRRMIRRLDRFCSEIYALNPDLLHVLPARARFVPYSHISLDDWRPLYTQLDTSRPLRIGHAPTNRAVKGTDLILAALSSLADKGYDFELILIEGLSHADARKQYERIDLLIDQIFYGWYGGLAIEAMALGKPVLAYIRKEDLGFIPTQMSIDLPLIRATPDTIEQALQHVLEMPRTALHDLAQRSRDFVEKWHDPVKIATEIRSDYEQALRVKGRH